MSQYNNILTMQDLSNNSVNVKVMKDELGVNFPFNSITGIRKLFCDGQYPELLVVSTIFTESNDGGVICV
jgi:hypothetical protein